MYQRSKKVCENWYLGTGDSPSEKENLKRKSEEEIFNTRPSHFLKCQFEEVFIIGTARSQQAFTLGIELRYNGIGIENSAVQEGKLQTR